MYTAERHFVTIVRDQMQNLVSGYEEMCIQADNSTAGDAQLPFNASHALAIIKTACHPVQARAVLRATALCENVISDLNADSSLKFGQSLAALQSVFGQYAEGLYEIDPEFKQSLLGAAPECVALDIEKSIEPVITESVITEPTLLASALIQAPEVHTENIDLEMVYLEGKHAVAANTLQPLLRFVSEDTDLQALKALMKTASNDVAVLPEAATTAPQQRTVKFENLMRPITSLILSEARYCGKSVSISYAADFESLGLELANHVQSFLEILCLNIIGNGVGKPATQISITGQEQTRNFQFSVNWSGYDISKTADKNIHFRRALASLQLIDGHIKFREMALQDELDSHVDAGKRLQGLEVVFPNRISAQNTQKNTLGTKIVSVEDGHSAKIGGASG